MMTQMRTGMMGAMLMAGATIGCAAATADDPTGIIRKPIPDRTVVFTFDDGCASHATIAAPILKQHGYRGTFYVSDAYGFRERKDWYMTWRQIKGMADDGFEIGNHTRGHGQLSLTDVGGCQAYVWTLEDEMIANRIPRPTTFCWPFYDVNPKFYPLLSSWGYLFARGGYGRVYRPAVDNPFDVPSFAVGGVGMTMEGFISAVQQATAGRVVVLCFHGVPDMEHAPVGTDPDLFEDMVDYMKDNHYKVIAMRDLAEYVDVAKAAKLPPTQAKLENPGPELRVKGDKPYVPKKRDHQKLSGVNTDSGQTTISGGTVSIDSFNNVEKGKPGSSQGAPKTAGDGEILMSGGCVLVYTGKGETTNRTLNLTGRRDTVTLDQSGTGLLKLTSPIVMSGYAESKTLVLAGSSAGIGEIACNIDNVYDRNGKATTSITKSGTGTWTLSGKNTYTGPTTVTMGTLSFTHAKGLSDKTEVSVADGAMLALNFKGEMHISKLTLDGKPQPAGSYSAATSPKFIKGEGILKSDGK